LVAESADFVVEAGGSDALGDLTGLAVTSDGVDLVASGVIAEVPPGIAAVLCKAESLG
jgi:hypothetical protein